MKRIKLAALDMDGTLLMSDKSIHPDTPGDIAYAASQGVHVVYSTGRDTSELTPYIRQLPQMRYGICTSGSIVYDFLEKKAVFRHAVPQEVILEVISLIGAETGMIHFLGDGASIVSQKQITHMEDYNMGIYTGLYRKVATAVPDMLEEAKRHSSIPKMNIYFRSQEDRALAWEKVKHLPLSFATAETTSLEMTAPGVSKARGLRELADYLGLSLEETAGIGDADNDREILEIVGVSVAMKNAEEQILAMCDLITDDNDHNGVGKALRRILDKSAAPDVTFQGLIPTL